MKVLVAGAHGQVGQHVVALLSRSEHEVRALVRDQTQVSKLEKLGAEAVVADLKGDVSHAVKGCDAIIFAAGSGGKDVEGVDRDGAIKLMRVAQTKGVRRYVMLSSMGADTPERGPDELRDYLKAKKEADVKLRASELTYTIIRPGQLTNEAATGHIRAAKHFDEPGKITREDVAKTLVMALEHPNTHGKTFEILNGDDPIGEALASLA